MKNIIFILLSIFVVGCSYEGKNVTEYLDDPGSIIKDPHFAAYKEERDALESQYLHGQIEYSDYKEKVDVLDQKYNKEVEERNAKMMSNP